MTQSIGTALVVDDSRLARIALSKLLQKRSIDVHVVGTGSEALEYLSGNSPDVVFMDYMMPDMDGFEATRRIRDIDGGDVLPVVMYTSQDTAEDREKARQLGIAGFLSKPSGEHKLDEVLAELGEVEAMEAEPARAVASAGSASTPRNFGRAPADRRSTESHPPSQRAVSAPATGMDADEVRNLARESAEIAVESRLEAVLRDRVEALRAEIDEVGQQARSAAEEAAYGVADAAAREAAEAIADRTARLIAENVAQETASRVAQEVGPEASKRIMADLRRDVRTYVSELFAADAFREQITDVVVDAGLPKLQEAVIRDAAPRIREEISSQVLKAAEERAVDAARRQGSDAAIAAADEHVGEALARYREDSETRLRAAAADEVKSVRRLVVTVSVVGLVLIAAGVAVSLFASGAFG
ncbi:MAG TPA: response regulator [Gammaproteobacteria bacterium]|nr:response regulator [Gammaproteobacteria bacterium]